jgi:RNA polymerase sigma-70 factor, ECF subfamily
VTFDDPAHIEEERRWLDAIRGGDPRATERGFERVFARYAEPLYRVVLLPKLGDRAAAEDALADTFRKALESLGQYRDMGKSLWPYLSTIAANRAHDIHRERARRGRALASFEALLAPLAAPVAAPDAGPDRDRVRQAVDRVLGALPPRYRRAIELRFFEERPREACAAALEVKLGTFDVVLLRSLRAFRERWQELIGASPEAA